MITILPKLPVADDEYTPEQRRAIDARLADCPPHVDPGFQRDGMDPAGFHLVNLCLHWAKRCPPNGMAAKALVQRLKSTSCSVYGSP